MSAVRIHGGADAQGAARWDFSTCSHPAGPCALARAAVQAADPSRYPDPGYTALCAQLAVFHGVAPERVLVAASASEFIQRITAVVARLRPGAVQIPALAYGDYAAAAQAWGLPRWAGQGEPALRWQAELDSPDGAPSASLGGSALTVLDRAYGPLRLQGEPWPQPALDAVFQLFTPNKALGLCGVRAAYVIAPPGAQDLAQALRAAEPSWALGTHGLAMLQAWAGSEPQQRLRASLPALTDWRARLIQALAARGFVARSGAAPFVCLRLPAGLRASPLALRERGIAVRDCASFGLPGHWRLNALGPEAQAALLAALDELQENP